MVRPPALTSKKSDSRLPAGVAGIAPCIDVSDEELRRVVDVNYIGVWNCYTRAAKQMIAQGPVPDGTTGYKILGCASIVAFKPFPLLTNYSATKWAVRGLTQVCNSTTLERVSYRSCAQRAFLSMVSAANCHQGFAMEVAKHKIQVNAYAPGIVGTAMWDQIDEKLGEIDGRPKGETIKKYVTELTAMGRTSTPDDVAKVVGGFLCGSDSDFMTGQTIVVDGGTISRFLCVSELTSRRYHLHIVDQHRFLTAFTTFLLYRCLNHSVLSVSRSLRWWMSR